MRKAAPRHPPHGTPLLVEELAMRYKQDHDRDVAAALLRSCQPLRIVTVRRLMHEHGVPPADWPDFGQIADIAILEAADRYDPPQPFPAFARLVIASRCSDRMKSQRRAENHLDRTCDVALLVACQLPPDQALLQQEYRERVREVFQQLPSREQQLWEVLADDPSVNAIGRIFAMSWSRANNEVIQFRAKIRALLLDELA